MVIRVFPSPSGPAPPPRPEYELFYISDEVCERRELPMSVIDLAVFAVIAGLLLDAINSQGYEGENYY